MFYSGFVESVLTFSLICWRLSLPVKQENGLQGSVKVCSKMADASLNNLLGLCESGSGGTPGRSRLIHRPLWICHVTFRAQTESGSFLLLSASQDTLQLVRVVSPCCRRVVPAGCQSDSEGTLNVEPRRAAAADRCSARLRLNQTSTSFWVHLTKRII